MQYDTVSDRYGKYLMEEVLPEVEKNYKLRQDGYSRAVAGVSSGAICAINVASYFPGQFSRVLSHRVRREAGKNLRVWLSDGADDIEN